MVLGELRPHMSCIDSRPLLRIFVKFSLTKELIIIIQHTEDVLSVFHTRASDFSATGHIPMSIEALQLLAPRIKTELVELILIHVPCRGEGPIAWEHALVTACEWYMSIWITRRALLRLSKGLLADNVALGLRRSDLNMFS